MNQKGILSLQDIFKIDLFQSFTIFYIFLLCFQAGIDKTRLAIVLESEAAYIFCKDLRAEKFEDGFNNIDVFSLGQRYLVLNAEGKSQTTASYD